MCTLESLIFENQLGAGAFGEVLLARDCLTDQKYAVKMIHKGKGQQVNIQREVEAGKRLQHPNIGQFVAHFEDDSNDYIVYEFIRGYDLFTYFDTVRHFKEYSESEAQSIIRQLVSALNYCHSKGVLHLDVKLDNIMIDPTGQNVKLIDFGLCDFITAEKGDTISRRCGSEEYCAPEILTRSIKSFSGIKLDVWSLGVVLYSLLGAQFPFDAKQRRATLEKGGAHPEAAYNFPLSDLARDLLMKMISTDVNKRVSMAEVAAHPWLSECQAL